MNVEVQDAQVGPRPDTAAMVRTIVDLPALPTALVAAVSILSQDDAPITECIDAIGRDQALAVRMLRLANSAFYGASGLVGSVGDAVQMLGLRTVASVVTVASLRSTLAQITCEGFCFETYWRHALSTAIIARELAPSAGQDPGESFLTGLLHDVGLLVLVMSHPVEAEQAMALSRACGMPLHLAERKMIGITHEEIGARVARHWCIPSTICHAIATHHAPGPAEPGERLSLAALVHLSSAVAQRLDSDTHENSGLNRIENLLALDLPEGTMQELAIRTEREVAAFAAI